MKCLINFYSHLFFQNTIGIPLEIYRILFFSSLFLLYFPTNLQFYASIPVEIWDPHITFAFLNLSSLSTTTLQYIAILFKVSLFFSAIGFLTNLSIACSTVLAFILFALKKSFISSEFHEQLPFLTMLVFSFSRSAGKFSFDYFLFKKNPKVDYNWPYRVILFATCMMYLNAAVSKVRISGMHWFSGESLQIALNQSFRNFSIIEYEPLQAFFLQLFNNSLFLVLTATLVFLFELLSPMALLSTKQTKIWLLLWAAFHFLIFLTIGIYSSIHFIPIFIGLYPYSQNPIEKLKLLLLKFR